MLWKRFRRGGNGDCPKDSSFAGETCANPGCDCPLSSVNKGCRCRVRRHHGQGAIRQRLLDMGLVPNAELEVMRVATLGDPMEIRVGDSYVTLRKREAAQIEIIPS